jgi:hypothetical protein
MGHQGKPLLAVRRGCEISRDQQGISGPNEPPRRENYGRVARRCSWRIPLTAPSPRATSALFSEAIRLWGLGLEGNGTVVNPNLPKSRQAQTSPNRKTTSKPHSRARLESTLIRRSGFTTKVANHTKPEPRMACIVLGAAIPKLAGFAVGKRQAFLYRLQAQTALCHKKLEEINRREKVVAYK